MDGLCSSFVPPPSSFFFFFLKFFLSCLYYKIHANQEISWVWYFALWKASILHWTAHLSNVNRAQDIFSFINFKRIQPSQQRFWGPRLKERRTHYDPFESYSEHRYCSVIIQSAVIHHLLLDHHGFWEKLRKKQLEDNRIQT